MENKKINVFNALDTIRTLAEENSIILSKIDEIEKEIAYIQKETALTEAITDIEWLKKQESAKNDIIEYIVEHGTEKVIVPINIWHNWKSILCEFFIIEENFFKEDVQRVAISYYKRLKEIVVYGR
jgi:hypothetical protein